MGRTFDQRELAAQGMKRCSICKEAKPYSEFHKKHNYYNDDGSIKYRTYGSYCKLCNKDRYRSWRTSSIETYSLTLVKALRHRSKQVNVPFDINKDDLVEQWNKQDGHCFYTGIVLDLTLQVESRNHPHHLYPSLDRLNPNLGYVKENVVWCVYYVNRMKSDLNYNEFLTTCSRILEYVVSFVPVEIVARFDS